MKEDKNGDGDVDDNAHEKEEDKGEVYNVKKKRKMGDEDY